MTSPTTYRIKRGATLVVPIEAVGAAEGDLAIVTAIDAGLKKVRQASIVPPPETPRVATFAVDRRAAAGEVGPGWNLSLTAAQTAELEPATYALDVAIEVVGTSEVLSETLLLKVEQAVSR